MQQQAQELMLSLTYKKAFDEEAWQNDALLLQERLRVVTGCNHVGVIGRARKSMSLVGDRSYLTERLNVVVDGKLETFEYRQNEGQFSQPNALVNQEMLTWAVGRVRDFDSPKKDFLELYCGNGNFTVPISKLVCRRTLATEASSKAVECANWALQFNGCKDSQVVRMTSKDIASALFKDRLFNRLSHLNLDEFQFGSVLVDPPRTGLDEDSRQLLSAHVGQIIYISCNPESLARDIKMINDSSPNKIEVHQLVCFDQFPGTDHIECGVDIRISSIGK